MESTLKTRFVKENDFASSFLSTPFPIFSYLFFKPTHEKGNKMTRIYKPAKNPISGRKCDQYSTVLAVLSSVSASLDFFGIFKTQLV